MADFAMCAKEVEEDKNEEKLTPHCVGPSVADDGSQSYKGVKNSKRYTFC